ncbi:Peroxiredoxin [Bernardetia litoralis DSM 6794]|uniref:Peroxiredoxin n=1 Tax=Bernardetia litoralis (strain ATCC 23117 / DSM 6794 / NBRC 15988 / NCIMB 1366 / Fx l1 / Sio-4) TaxID=880071 RepID=I4AF86_BERLS|nr:peroxiredoxin-like family protein [Bernardetia litoralis]AFM02621.1 Peroxiredoxin [Bernardetia litoralis DSM 6794]
MSNAIKPREKTPNLKVRLINGLEWSLEEQNPENFTLVVFYRGLHCPVCKNYLEDLATKIEDFKKRGVNVVAMSSDSEERAKEAGEKWNIPNLPLGFNFSIEEARKWGLYVSEAISDKEPKLFSEPGIFLIRPDQTLYFASIQTMPFARPDFKQILGALDFVIAKKYPARGEA